MGRLNDDSAITEKASAALKDGQARLSAILAPLVAACGVVHASNSLGPLDFDLGVLESKNRPGEFYILVPGANEYAATNTNVVKLYQMLDRSKTDQLTYYQPGIGTFAPPGVWGKAKKWFITRLDLVPLHRDYDSLLGTG